MIRLSGFVVSSASVKSVPAGTGTTNLPSRSSTFVVPIYQPSSFLVNVIGVWLFGKVTFIDVNPPIAAPILSTALSTVSAPVVWALSTPLFLSFSATSFFSRASFVKSVFLVGIETSNSFTWFLSFFSPRILSVCTASTVGVSGLFVSI